MGKAGREGRVSCSTACTGDGVWNISEKARISSAESQGWDRAGRVSPGMFWERGAFSKASESKIGKRGGVYGPYNIRILC